MDPIKKRTNSQNIAGNNMLSTFSIYLLQAIQMNQSIQNTILPHWASWCRIYDVRINIIHLINGWLIATISKPTLVTKMLMVCGSRF
jgi:hypothetical protein